MAGGFHAVRNVLWKHERMMRILIKDVRLYLESPTAYNHTVLEESLAKAEQLLAGLKVDV